MEFRLEKIGIVFMLIIAVLLVGCAQNEDQSVEVNTSMPVPDEVNKVDEMVVDEQMASQADVTYVVTGENFAFVMDGEDAPELRVKVGDIVRIEFSSTQGFHDWVVDEFNAATEKVRETDGSTYVEFEADQVGTFEYYCSVGSHRANGMVGKLIVE